MRFKRVEAEAFGPLTSAALEFSEGLNVVWGPNEAAKSSWHGAMYAALCGRRRGRGASVRDEGFRKRHQPWDGDAWAVGAVIELDTNVDSDVKLFVKGRRIAEGELIVNNDRLAVMINRMTL